MAWSPARPDVSLRVYFCLARSNHVYLPQEQYTLEEKVVFPTLDWRQAEVVDSRDGHNPDLGDFSVIKVRFENGEEREFASGLEEHPLNSPSELMFIFVIYYLMPLHHHNHLKER